MNSKIIIEQLIKIAQKQQLIINRLAQAERVSVPDAQENPQQLRPNAPRHMPAVAALKAKVLLNKTLHSSIVMIELRPAQRGQELAVTFKSGQIASNWKALQDAFNAAQADQSLPTGISLSGKEA